ncbi:MAG TPA: MoxR family ATPase [Clostridiales bacterium]|nr:MoxR family ATPase [Clostridiales bacterium]
MNSITSEEIRDFSKTVEKIEGEIGKKIIGQKKVIREVLIAIFSGGNVLLEGVPGLGKTRLVRTIGEVMDLKFRRIQFTPDLMPADITGTNIVMKDERGSRFEFQPGPLFSNIVLADEINRATPKTQSALLEAMGEGTVTVGGVTRKLPSPYFVLATQNPLEQEGTYPLPEAQMDRFFFKIEVDYPSLDELHRIIDITTVEDTSKTEKIVEGDEILKLQKVAMNIPIAKAVQDYALRLILGTHPENPNASEAAVKYLRYGSSPRGAQTLIQAAKVRALIEGRYNVAFSDIREVAHPALRHRLFLNFEAMADDINVDNVIDEIIGSIEE